MTNQPTEYEQVTYNSPGGAQMGKASNEAIAFYGQTPTARAWALTNISTTAFTSTNPYGFATSTEGLQVSAALSTIIVALKALGLTT